MQQSEKLDLGPGPGFLSVGLSVAGAVVVASDLSWRNALVLTYNVSSGNYRYQRGKKNFIYLNAFAEACHSRPISTRIRTHL